MNSASLDLSRREEASITTALATLNALVGNFASLVRTTAELAGDLPRLTRETWKELCQVAVTGQIEQVHAQREFLLQTVERRLELIRQTQRLSRIAGLLTDQEDTESQELERTLNDLEAFQRDVFSRWQTLEDLEAMLLEQHTLSRAELETIRKTLPPFYQQWYAEDSKPF